MRRYWKRNLRLPISAFLMIAFLRNSSPPESIDGDGDLELQVLQQGTRGVLFELSRSLRVSSVTMDGKPLEFLQNDALEGSRISREGNDYVAVVLPRAMAKAEAVKL